MNKILVIGPEPSDFFTPIAKELLSKDFKVDLIEFRKDQKRTDLSTSYSNVRYGVKELFDFKGYPLITLLFNLCSPIFWSELLSHRSVKEALKVSLLHTKFSKIFKQYDLINFHYIDEGSMWLSKAVPKKKKVIFSFWGSDLFAANDALVSMQNDCIKRARIVTMQTPEMKQVFRKKFPDHKGKKLSLQRFGVLNSYLIGCDLQRKEQKDEILRERFKLPKDKLIVTISYSANPVSNHGKILEAIDLLGENVKSQIHLLLPFSYGGTKEYRQQIKDQVCALRCSYSVMEEFLDLTDLINLRIVSNIYIHANKTDAFSNSMLEYIYSGNVCLIASWLPYQLLRETKVGIVEFNNFEELKQKIEDVILNYTTLVEITKENPRVISENFSLDSTVKKWVDLIQKTS